MKPTCWIVAALVVSSCARPERDWTRASFTPLATGTTASLRGLGLAGGVVWAGGTGGTFVRCAQACRSGMVPGAAASDFRGLAALSADSALLLSAGSPARLFRTGDAGATWSELFHDARKEIFFDALAARDGQVLAVGDPIDGRFTLLRGPPFRVEAGPEALPGEGAFAASDSNVVLRGGRAWLLSGARVFRGGDAGWQETRLPFASSESSGAFALAMRDDLHGAVTGGDYKAPARPGVFAVTHDGGETFALRAPPPGYRSGLAFAGSAVLVTGTSGTDVSVDEGASWRALGAGFNALAADASGVYAAGAHGEIAVLR